MVLGNDGSSPTASHAASSTVSPSSAFALAMAPGRRDPQSPNEVRLLERNFSIVDDPAIRGVMMRGAADDPAIRGAVQRGATDLAGSLRLLAWRNTKGRRTCGLSVSLAGPDSRVVAGVVTGMLHAASPIQVIVGSFLPNSLKQHQRMSLQQQPPVVPALPAPPTPVASLLCSLLPFQSPMQFLPPGNGFHAPPSSIALSPQPHGSIEHDTLNLNTAGFTMVGWPTSYPPMLQRASPDINVNLTPQE